MGKDTDQSYYALISVSDKTGVVDLAKSLIQQHGYRVISTGGTYRTIYQGLTEEERRDSLLTVEDLTGFPEILGGRVKTLHPKIHGAILARRGFTDAGVSFVEGELSPRGCDTSTTKDLDEHDIPLIDVVVCNLYPFHKACSGSRGDDTDAGKSTSMSEALELIDIGGVTLLRAAAKNWPGVYVLSDPEDYSSFLEVLGGPESIAFRRRMALKSFKHTMEYDAMIAQYLQDHEDDNCDSSSSSSSSNNSSGSESTSMIRWYTPRLDLKYGCNPHQGESRVYAFGSAQLPFRVLNGSMGYINLLDALNSWQLVREARACLGLACAASFKHTSPAGVAVPGKIDTKILGDLYDVPKAICPGGSSGLTPIANAFLRARNCDPMSSFGDFIALSEPCDETTANLIKREISDGIIAPAYSGEALRILGEKKGGKYLILQVDAEWDPGAIVEFREMFGIAFSQERNTGVVNAPDCFAEKHIPTEQKKVPASVRTDLLLANITLKYSQSNNVVMAKEGQVIGIAAGQQSRVDAVKLAGNKAAKWYLRQHPRSLALFDRFRSDVRVKRQDKINALVRFVEGDLTSPEIREWQGIFQATEKQAIFRPDKEKYGVPQPLSVAEKNAFLEGFKGVSMVSDAFFPFRDNIDHASRFGVQYIMQPGGSIADVAVTKACNEYGMTMALTGVRMFTH